MDLKGIFHFPGSASITSGMKKDLTVLFLSLCVCSPKQTDSYINTQVLL